MTAMLESRAMKQLAVLMVLIMGLLSLAPRAEAGFVASQALQTRNEDTATVERVLQNKVVKQRLQEMGLGLGLKIDHEVFNNEKAKRSEKIATQ
jgi:hypothetical protein